MKGCVFCRKGGKFGDFLWVVIVSDLVIIWGGCFVDDCLNLMLVVGID